MVRFISLAILISLLTTSASTLAQEPVQVADTTFEQQVNIGAESVEIAGTGIITWLFFDVAAGALYLPKGMTYDQWNGNASKRLELTYFYEVTNSDFVEAAWEGLNGNLTSQQLEALKPRIEQLHQNYQTVSPGDRYALTYIPGKGTSLALNGKLLVTIEGDDFAESYFKIWLGENAMNRRFRNQILRQ